jgi:hypothetical protein
MFRTGDTEEIDRLADYNKGLMLKAYKSLINGSIDYFYQLDKHYIYVYTLSARQGYEVQRTTLDRYTYEPIGHRNIENVESFLHDPDYISGWLTLKIA